MFSDKIDFNKDTFSFDLVNFRKFLIENNITITIVGFAIGYYLRELIDSFYEHIIFCDENIHKITEYYIYIFNIKIYIGKFFISFLKFFISVLLVFYIARFLNDLVD